jgi:alcohol dehydrogenase (NADP+)
MKFSSASLLAGLAGVFALSFDTQEPLIGPQNTISQPLLGFGTWNLKISSENTTEAVSIAIQAGYRQIDCAAAYGNEVAVGKGIKDGLKKANISREDIWVTSKLWNDQYVNTTPQVENTL